MKVVETVKAVWRIDVRLGCFCSPFEGIGGVVEFVKGLPVRLDSVAVAAVWRVVFHPPRNVSLTSIAEVSAYQHPSFIVSANLSPSISFICGTLMPLKIVYSAPSPPLAGVSPSTASFDIVASFDLPGGAAAVAVERAARAQASKDGLIIAKDY